MTYSLNCTADQVDFPMNNSRSIIDQMRTKNFYIILVFISASSISLWLFNTPSSSIRVIVNKTHKQINTIKNLPSDMQKKATRELNVDPVYLQHLGFSKTTPRSPSINVSKIVPVVASGVEPGNLEAVTRFLKSVRTYHSGQFVVLVDLGLSRSEKMKLKTHCNSTFHCKVHLLDFDKYPSHVQYLDIKSYRPVSIQELLMDYGAVIWVELNLNFISSKMNETLARARSSGIAAWTIKQPTSSLTHPRTFQFFKTKPSEFFFHRAVAADHLVIFNNKRIQYELMEPWVKCALVDECISPTGAQSIGCNYGRRPLFNYSGCHHYDMSALNVLLGLLFDFDVSKYATSEQFVGIVNLNNSTTPRATESDSIEAGSS